ncbi:hypothetical protein FCM35_KLT10425 [Carex littledalei]|uniref:Uncharacterized protein n=1 Tax=Carex littledalei TaxID=544730 RepID=A0A833QU55_9POAL|nr:hypothetical protein FCM35_KLT10425 [Carex littledalei]
MLCYVGKATKIFMIAMAVLVVAGLVLAFALIIHRIPRHRSTQDGASSDTTNCDQGNSYNVACSPVLLPDPGGSGVPAPPLLNPQPPPPAAQGPTFPSKPNFQ